MSILTHDIGVSDPINWGHFRYLRTRRGESMEEEKVRSFWER